MEHSLFSRNLGDQKSDDGISFYILKALNVSDAGKVMVEPELSSK